MGLPRTRICHVASGDAWAGAEVQVATLMSCVVKKPDFEISAIILNEGRLTDELRKCGVDVTVIDEKKTNSLQIVTRILRHFWEHRIDIVHTHRYKESILAGIAARLIAVPWVVRTVHGLPEPYVGFRALKMRMYNLVDSLVLKYLVEIIIAVSSELKDRLAARYRENMVVCIRNSIDVSRIWPVSNRVEKKRELGIPLEGRVIGTVGRLTAVKRLEDFLAAARIIGRRRGDVTYLVVGDGPRREALKQLAVETGLEQCVRFLGSRDDVYDIMDVMDICVIPSLHEGIPTVLLEALAMGKPVVATRVGGIPEVLKEEGLGVLIEPRNPLQLAEACVGLLNGAASSEDLKVRRQRLIDREFCCHKVNEGIVDLYRALAGRAIA